MCLTKTLVLTFLVILEKCMIIVTLVFIHNFHTYSNMNVFTDHLCLHDPRSSFPSLSCLCASFSPGLHVCDAHTHPGGQGGQQPSRILPIPPQTQQRRNQTCESSHRSTPAAPIYTEAFIIHVSLLWQQETCYIGIFLCGTY